MATATAPKQPAKPQPAQGQGPAAVHRRQMGRQRSGKTFATVNPATGEVICQVAEGDKADIDLAVKAARKAFEDGPWPKMNAAERGRLLNKLADPIEQTRTSWPPSNRSTTASRCRDRPGRRPAADHQVLPLLRRLGRQDPRQDHPGRGPYFCYTRHEPVGVVGQIIPVELPAADAGVEVGPGPGDRHCIVLKPAEQTPLTALRVARLAQEAGFPDGVINVVPGYGPTAGAALSESHGRRQGRLHRRRHHRQDHHGGGGPEQPQARQPGAGRQEPEHRLRRRRPRRRRRGRLLRPVLQPGPVLLRRQPAVRRGEGPRPVRREAAAKRRSSRRSAIRSTRTRRRGRRCRRSRCDRIMGYIEAGKKEGAKC